MSEGCKCELVNEFIHNPGTEAWEFVAKGPNGETITVGAHRQENKDSVVETGTELAAAILVAYAGHSDDSQEEFLKQVVREYNDRKQHSQHSEWGQK